jgi:hypothetical protein
MGATHAPEKPSVLLAISSHDTPGQQRPVSSSWNMRRRASVLGRGTMMRFSSRRSMAWAWCGRAWATVSVGYMHHTCVP